MKKLFLQVLAFTAVAFMAVSCASVSTATRENLKLPPIKLTRADYTLTNDLSAEAEVKVYNILIWSWIKGADASNMKIGKIVGSDAGATIDESLAIFNLLEKNPEIDYVTNVRYIKTYTQKPFVKTYKTKIMAKGIILKADK